MAGGVCGRAYFEGGSGNVRGGDGARREISCAQCYRDAAGACAYIGDAMRGHRVAMPPFGRLRLSGALRDDFDYVFGFWTRDQGHRV